MRSHVGGANGFVRFLRVFLRFVEIGLLGQVVRAEALGNQRADLIERVVRDAHGIGAHVGDQRDGTFLAQLDAFVQFLRERHGALGGVAQAIVSSLLQLGSGERRRRIAPLFLLRDGRDDPFGFLHGRDDFVGVGLIIDFDVFALELAELGFEDRRRAGIQHGVDGPVFLRDEGANFLFALDDQAQGDGLHASGGKAAADFVPEQRRNFVTDDAIEDAASLLRVHQMLVHLRGLLESGFDGFLRDFVEHHAINFGRSAVRGRLFLLGLGGGFRLCPRLFRPAF